MKSSQAAFVCDHLATWVVLGLMVTLAGCASTRVQPLTVYGSQEPLPRPDRILVYDLAVSPEAITPNGSVIARLHSLVSATSQTEEQLKVGREVAAALSEELVQRLRALGLPAERASGLQPLPDGTLAIEGQFISIDEGNRLRRAVIGFGVGESDVRTLVQVYLGMDGMQHMVQEFETSAESSKAPGMAATMGAGAAAHGAAALGTAAMAGGGIHAATESRQTAEADARRTADVLVKRLAQFFAAQGWIAPEAAQ
jgi:Domain of unknown function (DUF4410)